MVFLFVQATIRIFAQSSLQYGIRDSIVSLDGRTSVF